MYWHMYGSHTAISRTISYINLVVVTKAEIDIDF